MSSTHPRRIMLQTVRLQIFEQSGGSVCFDVMFDMDQFQGFSKDNYLGMYLCQCVCVSSNNTFWLMVILIRRKLIDLINIDNMRVYTINSIQKLFPLRHEILIYILWQIHFQSRHIGTISVDYANLKKLICVYIYFMYTLAEWNLTHQFSKRCLFFI